MVASRFLSVLPQLEHAVGQAGALVVLLAALLAALTLAGRWVASNAAEIRGWVIRSVERIGALPPVRRSRERHPKTWSFVARRFAATEYLGLHLTIGLGLSLGALWLFGGIAEGIIHPDPLTQFDLTIANVFHRHTSPLGLWRSRRARACSGRRAALPPGDWWWSACCSCDGNTCLSAGWWRRSRVAACSMSP
jgi:hypothetical protein